MPFYAKLHMVLQARRQDSTANHKAPPVVLLIGGPDCGKTALARLLINYSVRQQDHVLLVDLRPFGNCISLPGCIGAGYFRRIIDAEVGEHCLSPAEMLFYLFCGTTPPPSRLYERQVELLAQTIQTKHQKQQQEQREQKESLVQDK
jgi:polynucleotide 5'-kinase involved in rRNA processing